MHIYFDVQYILYLNISLCNHTIYFDIQLMLTCNLCWHTTNVDIQFILTYNLCWHATYVDKQLMLTCNLCWYATHLCQDVTNIYVDTWLMLTWNIQSTLAVHLYVECIIGLLTILMMKICHLFGIKIKATCTYQFFF